MDSGDAILVGRGEGPQHLLLSKANRHGLISGATGTGKTVTLQVLAEGLSRHGVPTFMADVKGDLSGIALAGARNEKIDKRLETIGIPDYEVRGFPTVFWDLFGEQGHPIRTTVSEMGPLLLSRLMDLSEAQEGVLNIVFRVADEQGFLILDLKDLQAMLKFVADNASELTVEYGNVSKASVGAIQRRLLTLEEQGGDHFFGEPALRITDLIRTEADGFGTVNLLAADRLMRSPRLYATFLLWLLSELFEEMPEVGDVDKPRLVFFFDEAHLLFEDAPKALMEKIEQVVRLIRSKGVGVFFVTQNPIDIPDEVLGQLGNRFQHALRAFSPRDQKAVRAAAETFRVNPKFDTGEVITQLGVGEALVSTLDAKGSPTVVDRALIRPPSSRIGPATPGERSSAAGRSPHGGKYDQTVDRESAYEILKKRAEEETRAASAADESSRSGGGGERRTQRSSGHQGIGEALMTSVFRSFGNRLGREIARGVLGAILRSR